MKLNGLAMKTKPRNILGQTWMKPIMDDEEALLQLPLYSGIKCK